MYGPRHPWINGAGRPRWCGARSARRRGDRTRFGREGV